jgi:hypothetical protein
MIGERAATDGATVTSHHPRLLIQKIVDRVAYALVTWDRFPLPIGKHLTRTGTGGYYIDFRVKALSPTWPPDWFPYPGFHRYMGISQWGLGSYERYLSGEGEVWLDGSVRAANHLLETQERDGRASGGWLEPQAYGHTYVVRPPWLSAMAQGQCASLLVRMYAETHVDAFADVARRALQPMMVTSDRGGVQSALDGGMFLEEYPTNPPSFVLNGGIFALWGAYDVATALGDDSARRIFSETVETLDENLSRWDIGFWSRYDLFPHRLPSVASYFYHFLHIHQLRALSLLEPERRFGAVADRFASYAASRVSRLRALAHKVAFRVAVPKW